MAISAFNAAVQDSAGNVLLNFNVEVRDENTNALAVVYADSAATIPLGNPFVWPDGTHLLFYVEAGVYRITATKGSLQIIWRHEQIGAVPSLVPDGDKGDITVSGGIWTIDNDVVSNAKLANMATTTIKGRQAAGSGDPEDVTIGGGLELTAGPFLSRSALTGDVTASIGSNSTTIANDAVSNTKLANMATATLKGRGTAGTGDPEDIALGVGLAITTGPTLGLNPNAQTASITFIIDGGGATIATGLKGFLEVPFACTIQQWTLLADQSGSIVVDIWKDTYANFPPTVADVITASAKPTITTAQKGQSATLTGWTTSIAAGDILAFNVNSVTTIQKVTLALKVAKT